MTTDLAAPPRRKALLCAAVVLAAAAAARPAAAQAPAALPPVVVWDFDNQTVAGLSALPRSQADWLQRSLSESLVATLLRVPGLVVVDRLRMNELLAEQKLAVGELADDTSRLRLGRIAGAARMVFGGFFVVGDTVQVHLRVVDTASSRVLYADESAAALASTMAELPALEQRVARALGGLPGAATAAADAAVWQAYDAALALVDAGQLDAAVAALRHLLERQHSFEPAERMLLNLLARLARR